MTSRAELADEPRTMQFVIERVCTLEPRYTDPRYADRIAKATAAMPHTAWVEYPPADGAMNSCGGLSYRLTAESKAEVLARAGLPSSSGSRVCEHMGYLCE